MSDAKVGLRAAALARRDALTSEQCEAAAQAIAARPFPVDVMPGQVIAGYSAIRNEIDPMPLMREFERCGARLALPAIAARDQPLIFRAWSVAAKLVRGQFDIWEPPADASVVVPDIVLVPLAAFDRAGHRIGYGAGYYDRTLGQLRAAKPMIAAGLAFSVQEIAAVPSLPHDMPLDYIATERETIEIKA
jgi:5-formyltetrahydrofolate cyclo-ligase